MITEETRFHRNVSIRQAFERGQRDYMRSVSFYQCPYADIAKQRSWENGWRYESEKVRAK